MNKLLPSLCLAASALCLSPAAQAGVYSDDLSRCLVNATSAKDKTDLIRWMFANAALHPQVATISSVSTEQRVRINRNTATLIQRLLTQNCRKPTQNVFKYESKNAFESSFQVLGQVAMRELMSDPKVGNGFGDFAQYLDEAKMRELGLGNK